LEIYEEKLGADDANVAKTKNNLVNNCFIGAFLFFAAIFMFI